jgi:hypothetical protein
MVTSLKCGRRLRAAQNEALVRLVVEFEGRLLHRLPRPVLISGTFGPIQKGKGYWGRRPGLNRAFSCAK